MLAFYRDVWEEGSAIRAGGKKIFFFSTPTQKEKKRSGHETRWGVGGCHYPLFIIGVLICSVGQVTL